MNKVSKNKKNILPAIASVIIVALCGVTLLNSCSEDFLEPTPLSFYEPGVTLSSETGMRAVLAYADRNLRHFWTHSENNVSHNSNPLGTEYMFSDLKAYGKTDESATGLNFSIATGLTPQNAGTSGGSAGNIIQFFWNDAYDGIKFANTIISFIDQVEGMSQDDRDGYLGRALFHRSFRYYNLVFQFGDVPLVTKIPEVPKLNFRSTKKEAILEMITLDMEKAVELVPEQSTMQYRGMVNKGACRMLLIKCYLATNRIDKALEQANILIDQSGYSLIQGGDGLGRFGEFIVGGEPDTWPITRNVIWDLHRSENKLRADNTEVIMAMPNRGLAGESFRQWLQMRIYCPYWQSSAVQSPDSRQALDHYARSQNQYNKSLDITRAVGRGIGVFRPTYFAQHSLWVVNGVKDEGDLRHRSDVGNWVRMTDLKYNNPQSDFYGKNLMLYHPGIEGFSDKYWDDIESANGTAAMEAAKAAMEARKGNILTNDTIRCWFDWPHYKNWNLDVGAEANVNATAFNGGTGGPTGGHCDIYLYRLAEAYLLRAEIKFYLGDIAGATDDVNEVRKRARCQQLYTTVNIGDIMNERARELYMEEWRNVELSRVSRCLALTGKPDEWGNTYDINTYDKQSGREPTGGSYWWQRIVHYNDFHNSPDNPIRAANRTQEYTLDKRNFYWPVRQGVLDSNRKGRLAQGYGYEGYDATVPMWETWQEAVADEDRVD